MNPINILFNGNAEILNIVGNGDPMIDSLIIPNKNLCPLIGSEIKLDKKIGQGTGGTVFEITIPGKGTKKYAVKKGEFDVTFRYIQGPVLEKDERLEELGLSLNILKAFNPKVDFDRGDNIWISIPQTTSDILIKECITRKPKFYDAIPYLDGKKVEAPKGSYLCTNETYSEYYIGVLLGNAYRTEKCINFFDVYSMFSCENTEDADNAYDQYIFMDKIDTAEGKIMQCISMDKYNKIKGHSSDIQDGVFLQTMFAIAFYQSQYKISHNDLHEDNVFVEFVKKTDESKGIVGTTFDGQYLYDCDWYHYQIGNVDLYLPAIPVIVKIGDFGLTVKYSHPIVGDEFIFETGYDQGGDWGPWIPNQFIPQYDSVFHTTRYIHSLFQVADYTGSLLGESLKYIVPSIAQSVNLTYLNDAILSLVNIGMINKKTRRPNLKKLPTCRTAYDLLTGPVTDKYRIKPRTGKIVTLGRI